MDRRPVAAFYAGGRFIALPFAGPEAVLAYGRHHGVTHLVLEEAVIRDVRPQLISWLEAKAPRGLEPLVVIERAGRRVVVLRLR